MEVAWKKHLTDFFYAHLCSNYCRLDSFLLIPPLRKAFDREIGKKLAISVSEQIELFLYEARKALHSLNNKNYVLNYDKLYCFSCESDSNKNRSEFTFKGVCIPSNLERDIELFSFISFQDVFDNGALYCICDIYMKMENVILSHDMSFVLCTSPFYSPLSAYSMSKNKGPKIFYCLNKATSSDVNCIASFISEKQIHGVCLCANISYDYYAPFSKSDFLEVFLSRFCRYLWSWKDSGYPQLLCWLPLFFHESTWVGSMASTYKKPSSILREIVSRRTGGLLLDFEFEICLVDNGEKDQESVFVGRCRIIFPIHLSLKMFSDSEYSYFLMPDGDYHTNVTIGIDELVLQDIFCSKDDSCQALCLKALRSYDAYQTTLLEQLSCHSFAPTTTVKPTTSLESFQFINDVVWLLDLEYTILDDISAFSHLKKQERLKCTLGVGMLPSIVEYILFDMINSISQSQIDFNDEISEEVESENRVSEVMNDDNSPCVEKISSISSDKFFDPVLLWYLKYHTNEHSSHSSEEFPSTMNIKFSVFSCKKLKKYPRKKHLSRIIFKPSLAIRRRQLLQNVIQRFQVEEWVDMGCGNCEGFSQVIQDLAHPLLTLKTCFGIDINRTRLEEAMKKLDMILMSMENNIPLEWRSSFPLLSNFTLINSSLDNGDSFCNVQENVFLSFVEVIEHLPDPQTAMRMVGNAIRLYKPLVVLITTPNYSANDILSCKSLPRLWQLKMPKDINLLLTHPGFKANFREFDHKFEFSVEEFRDWVNDLLSSLSESNDGHIYYDVEYHGLGNEECDNQPSTQCVLLIRNAIRKAIALDHDPCAGNSFERLQFDKSIIWNRNI